MEAWIYFGTPVPRNGPWYISFPFNLTSQSVNWFNEGSGLPAGQYKITAIGRYNLNSLVYNIGGLVLNHWDTNPIRAWEDYYIDGIYVVSNPAFGPTVENQISNLTVDHYVGSSSDPNRQAILRYNHPGGKIGLRVKEEGWTSDNNYGNLGYYLEYTGDNIMDHDNDGLNDTLETTGILTGFGKLYTLYDNPDTDRDGLPDGLEVGELMVDPGTGLKYSKH